MSTPLITNGERLNQMMQDQVVRKMFENSLEKNVFFLILSLLFK